MYDLLLARGMDEASARRHARALDALVAGAGTDVPPERQFVVPGRIEVLGKHTDYAGGSSLTCGSARGIRVAAVPRSDGLVRISQPQIGRYAALSADAGAEAAPGHWSGYAAAVIRRLARNAPGRLRGADLWISSDLPRAAGMSSSSAFMIAVFLGLDAVSGFRDDPDLAAAVPQVDALAGYLACVENGSSWGVLDGERGVGTLGGSEDHVAILLSEARRVGRYRYAPFEREGSAALLPGCTFVVAASGVSAKKTGAAQGAYNRASVRARLAAEAWSRATGVPTRHLGDLAVHLAEHGGSLDPMPDSGGESHGDLRQRVEHFLVEQTDVIPAAWNALRIGDREAFGAAVDRSQEAAERLLGNQVPETRHLAASARRLGAVAASAFGAGFGGAVWALVPSEDASGFADEWKADYGEAFPGHAERARFFVDATGPGAVRGDGEPVW